MSSRPSQPFSEFHDAHEDWSAYIERFQCYCEANAVQAQRQVPLLISSIGPAAYKLLKGLVAPDVPSQKTLGDLAEAMKNHYKGKRNLTVERFKFRRMQQKSSESVNEFLARLRMQAVECEFGNLNEALREQFIQGVCNEGMQKRLLHEEKDLEETLKLAQSIESANQGSEAMNQRNGSDLVNAVAGRRTKPRQPCRRCGSPNHFADDCKFRNAECHKCSMKGHIAKMCRNHTAQSIHVVTGEQSEDEDIVNSLY